MKGVLLVGVQEKVVVPPGEFQGLLIGGDGGAIVVVVVVVVVVVTMGTGIVGAKGGTGILGVERPPPNVGGGGKNTGEGIYGDGVDGLEIDRDGLYRGVSQGGHVGVGVGESRRVGLGGVQSQLDDDGVGESRRLGLGGVRSHLNGVGESKLVRLGGDESRRDGDGVGGYGDDGVYVGVFHGEGGV